MYSLLLSSYLIFTSVSLHQCLNTQPIACLVLLIHTEKKDEACKRSENANFISEKSIPLFGTAYP